MKESEDARFGTPFTSLVFALINTHHLAQAEVYGRLHQPVLTHAIVEDCLAESTTWVTVEQPHQWAIGTVAPDYVNGCIHQTAWSSWQGLLDTPFIPSESLPLTQSALHRIIATERLLAGGRFLASRFLFLQGGLSPLIEAEFLGLWQSHTTMVTAPYPSFADLGKPDDFLEQQEMLIRNADQFLFHPLVRTGYRSILYEALSLNAIWLRHGFTLGWNPQAVFTRPALVFQHQYHDPDRLTALLSELLLHRVVCTEAIYSAIRSSNDRERDPLAPALQWSLEQHRASFDERQWMHGFHPFPTIFNTINTTYQGGFSSIHPNRANLPDHCLIDSASMTPTMLNEESWRAIMRYHVLKSLGRMLGARWLFQTGGKIVLNDGQQALGDVLVVNATPFIFESWILTHPIVSFGYREVVIELSSMIQLFRTYGAHQHWSGPIPSPTQSESSMNNEQQRE